MIIAESVINIPYINALEFCYLFYKLVQVFLHIKTPAGILFYKDFI